jgi:uncharacterized protein YndB with AHSA1/START domain
MQQAVAVERSIWIDAPRERAWSADTEPEQLDRWYANCCNWDIPALQVGTRIRFYDTSGENDEQIATIDVVDPPREFTMRWLPDQTYPGMTLITSFLLEVEGNGTRVTIRESGYEALPPDERQEWLDATGSGYTMSMENLKAHVEGTALPY